MPVSSDQTSHSQNQSNSTTLFSSAGGRSRLPFGDVLKHKSPATPTCVPREHPRLIWYVRSGGGRICVISSPGGPFKLSLFGCPKGSRKADNSPCRISHYCRLITSPLSTPSAPPRRPPSASPSARPAPHTHSSHTAYTQHIQLSFADIFVGWCFSILWRTNSAIR